MKESNLQRHVNAERDLMKSEIAALFNEKHTQSQCNSFVKLIHDGAALLN